MPSVLSVAAVVLGLAGPAPAGGQAAPPAAVPTEAQIQAAGRWAEGRRGLVSWAVITSDGRLRGAYKRRRYPSASVSKAMMLVAYLRSRGDRPVPRAVHRLLSPMIRISANRPGHAMHRIVGDRGLRAVGRAARMRDLDTNGSWANLRITAADQARFYWRFDDLVPRRHRRYARSLLLSITREQRWGIRRLARPHGWKALFKGGWRDGITHQAARLERGDRRMAIAVLTRGSPASERDGDSRGFVYGVRTIEGVAGRLAGG